MVKFIVEVDEEYIHKNADFSLTLEHAQELGGIASLAKMVKAFGFSTIEKKIEAGEKEFVITRDKIEERAYKIFDDVAAHLAALSDVFLKEEKAEEKETEG